MKQPSHNWLITGINRAWAARLAPLAHGELLDVGCGTKPYEELFRPYASRYVGLEHPATRHGREKIDVWGKAEALPFPDGSFDTVVAFQVLEHCEEPATVLGEMRRVLRPGGVVMVTTPFLWGVHEAPRDFYRYTSYGLEHLFAKAGFNRVRVEAVCGFWATIGLRFSYYLQRFRRGRMWVLIAPVQTFVQAFAAVADRIDRVERDTAGYVTVASRP
jgi:SAM-dependent methyltransferase